RDKEGKTSSSTRSGRSRGVDDDIGIPETPSRCGTESDRQRGGRDRGVSDRGPENFTSQVATSGFTQFPGQVGAPTFGTPQQQSSIPRPPVGSMDAHVSAQFPG